MTESNRPIAPPKDRHFIASCDGAKHETFVRYECTAVWRHSKLFEHDGYFWDREELAGVYAERSEE